MNYAQQQTNPESTTRSELPSLDIPSRPNLSALNTRVNFGPRLHLSPDLADQEQGIVIKALNNDNHCSAVQLAQLFTHSYSTGHPMPQVHDPAFWYSPGNDLFDAEHGPCLTSMVALDGNKIIAHMAIKHDANRRNIELLFPALHPDYRKQVFMLCRLFWETMEDLAKRQNWHSIYHYNLLSQPMWQLVASKCFGSQEMAIIPNAQRKPHSGMRRPHSRSSFLVMFNVFDAARSSGKTIYAPTSHEKPIRRLYAALGLERDFASLPNDNGGQATRKPLDKDLGLTHKEGFGIYHLTIEPSQVHTAEDISQATELLSNSQRERCTLEISLEDPRTPEVCQLVESLGYRFCGILPLLGNRDRILYTKFSSKELHELSLYTGHAKSIRSELVLEASQNHSEINLNGEQPHETV